MVKVVEQDVLGLQQLSLKLICTCIITIYGKLHYSTLIRVVESCTMALIQHEWHHYDIWEAIIKSTLGGEVHWPLITYSVFWAEHVMILKTAGLSPYFMVHGIEPLFPFDLTEATFLVSTLLSNSISTNALIVWRACQLQKQLEDIDCIQEYVCALWFASRKKFENCFKNQICDYNFSTSGLVLVQNLWIEKELNQKTKPHYLSSMVILHRMTGGSYLLAELDGTILRLQYVALRLLPYFPHSKLSISITKLQKHNMTK